MNTKITVLKCELNFKKEVIKYIMVNETAKLNTDISTLTDTDMVYGAYDAGIAHMPSSA